ncbi:MAG: hypothetical protein PSN35_03010, partial [Candidatus Thioglobus sp.]|nr:hypothetical protein [Candidatus Thioglobus sp.]
TKTPNSGEKAWESLEMLLHANVDHQLRITRHPELMSQEQLDRLKRLLYQTYQEELVVQMCNTEHCLDEKLRIV